MTTTNIIVLMGDKQPLGAIESLTIREFGSGISLLEVSRMRLDRLKLSEVFKNGNFHVASQVYPIHIVVLEDNKETIRATNVWISGIQTSYTSGEWILAEGLKLEAESITGTVTITRSA